MYFAECFSSNGGSGCQKRLVIDDSLQFIFRNFHFYALSEEISCCFSLIRGRNSLSFWVKFLC